MQYQIKLPPETVKIINQEHIIMSSHDDDKSVTSQFMAGFYEPHVQKMLTHYCLNKKNILDIGSNYGQHSVLMSKLNLDANIVAIEASLKNIDVLKNNLELNNITNVKIINSYLKDKVDKIDYYHWTGNSACAFGCTTEYGEKNHSEYKTTVDTNTLDNLIDFEPDFIKMDIEGAELLAIQGGKKVFKNCPPLLIELNKFTSESFFNTPITDLIDEIFDIGYDNGIIYHNNNFLSCDKDDLYFLMSQTIMMEVLFNVNN